MKQRLIRIALVVAVMACIASAYALGVYDGRKHATFSTDSREHRRIELELSDVKARLSTLERIGVEVELKDRTGTWFVYDGKVQ